MTWPGEIYLLRQMLSGTGIARVFLTGTPPIGEDPMNALPLQPALLAVTCGRAWQRTVQPGHGSSQVENHVLARMCAIGCRPDSGALGISIRP